MPTNRRQLIDTDCKLQAVNKLGRRRNIALPCSYDITIGYWQDAKIVDCMRGHFPSGLQSLEAVISKVKEMKFDKKSFRIDINGQHHRNYSLLQALT